MYLRKLLSRQNAIQASLLLIAVSILSKVMGLAREMMIAHRIGSSAQYDLFLVVFALPNVLMTTMTYTVSKAVTPFWQKLRAELGEGAAGVYAWRILLIGSGGFLVLGLVAILLAQPIVALLLPSSEPEVVREGARMFRLLSMIPFFFYWYSALASFLQAERYFLISSIALLLLNVVLIGALVLSRGSGVTPLLEGWIWALIVQGVWITLSYFGTRHHLDLPGLAKLPLPRAYLVGLLVAALQIVFIEIWEQLWTVVDRYLAQYFALPAGSISSINYAVMLYNIPLSIYNMGVGRAVFPFLSAHVVAGNLRASQTMLSRGVRSTFLILIPVWLFLSAFSSSLVTALYQRGAFDAVAARTTTMALTWLAAALLPNSLYVIFSVYLYAKRDFRTLVISVVIAFLAKVISGYLLVGTAGYRGLVISTVITSWALFAAIVSLSSFSLDTRQLGLLGIKVTGSAILATALSAIAARFVRTQFHGQAGVTVVNLAELLSGSLVFGALYLVGIGLLKVPEVMQVAQWMRRTLVARGS
jgi:putative peptidoglycan lipid II flippase